MREGKLRILIDGAQGFIGQNLVEFLLKDYNVMGVGHKEFDVSQKLRFPKNFRPDVVIHTATYGVYPSQKDKEQAWKTNMDGIKNLLEACISANVPLLINTGTCSEYGIRRDTNPLKETDAPVDLPDAYSITKAEATKYCIAHANNPSTKIITLRLFTPYGYHERQTRLIPYTILCALNHTKALLNNPNSTRSHVFIEDVVSAYSKTVKYQDKLKSGSIFNIGSAMQRSNSDVTSIVKSINPEFEYEWNNRLDQRVPDKATNWRSDITQARKLLRWKPDHTLEEGIKKTYDWFKEKQAI